MKEQAAEILEKAADGFESGRYGWTRGVSWSKNSRTGQESYCATGALHFEAGLKGLREVPYSHKTQAAIGAYRLADASLAEAAETCDVPGWNDYAASGLPEVVDKMKEAAKNLRNGELA